MTRERDRDTATEAERTRKRRGTPSTGQAAGSRAARPVTDQASEAASEVTREAKQGAREVTQEAKEAAREVAGEAKELAREAGHEVRARASERIDRGTSQAAERGDALARALRHAGEALREADQDGMGRFAEQAAGRVERFDGYLRRRDTEGMLHDLEELGRDHTGLFLSGAFVAGLAAARFLRASSPDSDERREEVSHETAR